MGFGGRRNSLSGNKDADGGPRATFSDLLPFLLEHKKVLSFVIVLSALGAVATLAQPLVVSQVITAVGEGAELGALVYLLIALVVVAALLSGFRHYLLQRTGEGVVLSSRKKLVKRMLHLPIQEFDQRRTGDLVSRVGSDTTLLRAVLTQGFVEALGGTLTFVGAVIAMIFLDSVLFGLTALVVAIAVTTVITLSKQIRLASRRAQERVGDLAASVERAIRAVRTVRATNATDREVEAVSKDAESAWRMGIQVARISALVVPISGIALQVAFLVVLGVGGYRVASGALDIANLIAFILFLFMMIMPLGQAFGAINSINQALGALGRIQEIIDLPSETEFDDTDSVVDYDNNGKDPLIAFKNVSFQYPEAAHKTEAEKLVASTIGEDALSELSVGGAPGTIMRDGNRGRMVLDSVSFAIPEGSRTALVGPSGAGKSTVLSLLERFYNPIAGTIEILGTDIATIPRTELRAMLGYVEQDAPALAGSIKDNLLLGSPLATNEDCVQVLQQVNLTEVLERSPQGLDAPVGEAGVMLSGGERQRLAIARALLQRPKVLLLDESTSSLDGANEALMRAAINQVATNRTLIVIAHRLSTVVDSDQIIVLDHGKVVGVGTHQDLVKSTPLYKQLAKHQLLV